VFSYKMHYPFFPVEVDGGAALLVFQGGALSLLQIDQKTKRLTRTDSPRSRA
jgi:hypothetical protein